MPAPWPILIGRPGHDEAWRSNCGITIPSLRSSRAKRDSLPSDPRAIRRSSRAPDVMVRLMGDFAIIHARTRYTLPDGRQGGSRYTDVWARKRGKWLAVSAHVTRV